MKNTLSNQEIARAAVIYYAKKEGEKLARKQAAEDKAKNKRAEKAAKKAKKAVAEFTDSVKDLNNSENKETKQQDSQQKAKKESFFSNIFKKKEDIIDVEATVITEEQPKQDTDEQPKEEAKEQSKQETKKEQPKKEEKAEIEVVETVKAGGYGRVAIGGDDWKAVSSSSDEIPVGTRVRVVKVESIIITVEPF